MLPSLPFFDDMYLIATDVLESENIFSAKPGPVEERSPENLQDLPTEM